MASDEENWIPVPENPDSNIVITIPVTEERTGNGSSWAEIVEAERPGVSHNHPARAVYPSHLRSVVNSFDGTMPAERLGELPAGIYYGFFNLTDCRIGHVRLDFLFRITLSTPGRSWNRSWILAYNATTFFASNV